MSIVSYKPKSKAFSLDVSTPINMSFEIKKALNEVSRIHGDIDEFVKGRLKYDSVKDLHKALAAEQIDVVALAIHQIEQGNAVINGDQTGIGKGRTAAALVRYGVKNGYNTVFVTEKSSLFADLYRDLKDIAFDDIVPLIFNADKQAEITDEDGVPYHTITDNRLFKRKSTKQLEELLDGESELPSGYDFLMTTYSQTNGDNVAKKAKLEANRQGKKYKPGTGQAKTEFLRRFSQNAIFILDESHNAGGSKSITGFYFREVLGNAKGAFYLSATFAKRPDNMPLYATKTSIKESGLSNDNLIEVFKFGGVALQEIAASELVKSGQMVRRQRTFEGIKVEWKYMESAKEKHWRTFDAITDIMRDISSFQKDVIKPMIADIDEGLFGDSDAELRKGTDGLGVHNSDYFSKLHNVIAQLMFSLKAQEVAEEAIRQLNLNKKVVIAFASTMGSFLADFGYKDGDRIDRMDFAQVLLRGLNGVMRYTVRDGKAESRSEEIVYDDLPAVAQEFYDDIIEKIDNTSTGLSMSPIDVLINTIEAAKRPKNIGGTPAPNYRVRECTGRKGQIRIEKGIPIYRRFKADKNKFFREFNNGDADVLLINQSASTGVSAHSSTKYADQRQRAMIIHQPELNINTEVQKRGRINRTGQVNLPEYIYLSSTIPSELRQFMILKAKLKSLDANTTGNSESSKSQLDMKDFFNKYGGQVIHDYLEKERILKDKLGNPAYRYDKREDDWFKLNNEDIPRRVTNRVQLLPVAEQEIFYKNVMDEYDEYIKDLKDKGTYDLETEYLDYQAELEKLYMFEEGSGGASSFGKDAYLERNKVKLLKKAMRYDEVSGLIKERIQQKTPEQYGKDLVDKMDKDYPYIKTKKTNGLKIKVKELEEKLVLMEEKLRAAPTSGKDEKETDKFQQAITRMQNSIAKNKQKLSQLEDDLYARNIEFDLAYKVNKEAFETLTPGTVVRVPIVLDGGGEVTVNGLVLGIDVNDTLENPYAQRSLKVDVAINSTVRRMKIPFTLVQRITATAKGLPEQFKANVVNKWNTSQTNAASETAYIATNNIFKAINRSRTVNSPMYRLIRFNTKEGGFKNGVLLGKATRQEESIDKFERDYKPLFMATVNLAKIGDIFKNASPGFEKKTASGILLRKKDYDEYEIIFKGRGNADILANEDLLRLVELTREDREQGKTVGKFTTYPPNLMGAKFGPQNFQQALEILSTTHSEVVASDTPNELPLELAKEQEEAAEKYMYKLNRPYDAGEYPTQKFIARLPEDNEAKYGYLAYSRKLTANERYKFGLIPVFDSIKEPYQEWLKNIEPYDLRKERLKELIVEAKSMDYDAAVKKLGQFIITNVSTPGNIEFALGEFSLFDFGKVLYQDKVGGKSTPAKKKKKIGLADYIQMMRLELAA